MQRAALVFFLAVPVTAAVSAAAETPQPFTVAVDVDAVSVTAAVSDKHGRPVKDLGPQDIELVEDGVRQDLSYFGEASRLQNSPPPLSVLLALDTSGSMNVSMDALQDAVLGFVHRLDGLDRSLVISFNDHVEDSADFTQDVARLERVVYRLQAGGSTSLYDAVEYSLRRIQPQHGRKAIIVFSDGVDTSSAADDRAVIAHARTAEATVYSIAFKPQGDARPGFLRLLSLETGGRCYTPRKTTELAGVFNEIAGELENQYLVGYTPKRDADGTWRQIALKVHRRGVAVRVRSGYFATRSRHEPRPTGATTSAMEAAAHARRP